jgi:hypothetical protein
MTPPPLDVIPKSTPLFLSFCIYLFNSILIPKTRIIMLFLNRPQISGISTDSRLFDKAFGAPDPATDIDLVSCFGSSNSSRHHHHNHSHSHNRNRSRRTMRCSFRTPTSLKVLSPWKVKINYYMFCLFPLLSCFVFCGNSSEIDNFVFKLVLLLFFVL